MTIPAPPEAESVLLILQGKEPADHPGIVDGYTRLQRQGRVRRLDIMPVFGPNGVQRGAAFWAEVLERALGNGTTLVVFQYYHSKLLPDPRPAIEALRRLPESPFIVSTLGDAFMNGYLGRPSVPRSFLQAAERSDLVMLTSMGGLADCIARFTSAPIVLSPNGACQVRFPGPVPSDQTDTLEYDVIFIGSRNASRNPFRPHHHFGRQRERLVNGLSKRFGRRFAVFGKGWDHQRSSQGPIPFDQQAKTARRGRVIVGGVPYSTARYYTSNRPFIQMTSGVPVVDTAVPGVETLLRPGEHWLLADERSLLKEVERVLELPDERRSAVGAAAAKYVLAHHTQADRVASLLENVRRLRLSRCPTESPTPPYLPFFLSEVNLEKEARSSTRNWPGLGP